MKTKKTFKWFTVFNHKKEEDYLRNMHKSGWRFEKVTGIGVYHFSECEPEDVIYRLDFTENGKKSSAEYRQIFADCGWEYIQDYAGYVYFKKGSDVSVPDEDIFSDDESRFDMIRRVYRKRMIPLLIIFSLCLVPQFLLCIFSFKEYLIAAVFGGIMLTYLGIFLKFAHSYYKYKKRFK